MIIILTKCSAIIPNNGIVKFLLTKDSPISSQDEHAFFNLLRESIDFAEGDTIKVTLEKVS
jgi:hypothetical protein